MAKYVCDYTKVAEVGNRISKVGEDLSTIMQFYELTMEQALSRWKSESKDKFIEHIHGKVHTNLEKIVTYSNNLGEHTIKCAKEVYDLEKELAQLNI